MRKAILKMPTEFSPLPIYESLTLNLTHLINKGINSIKVHFLFVSLITLFFAISLKLINVGHLLIISVLKYIKLRRQIPIHVIKYIKVGRQISICFLKCIKVGRQIPFPVFKYIKIGQQNSIIVIKSIKIHLKCLINNLMWSLRYLVSSNTSLLIIKFDYFTR